MKNEICNLIAKGLIPKEEVERVFRDSYTASAEMDMSFLCFEDQYEEVLANTTPDTIIIDIGCSYDAQCFYFTNYDRYIAVDLPAREPFDDVRFDNGNVEFYAMTGQQFIKEVLPTLNLDLNNVVAICNYVPSGELNKMVRDTFPNHYVYYTGNPYETNSITISKNNNYAYEKCVELEELE